MSSEKRIRSVMVRGVRRPAQSRREGRSSGTWSNTEPRGCGGTLRRAQLTGHQEIGNRFVTLPRYISAVHRPRHLCFRRSCHSAHRRGRCLGHALRLGGPPLQRTCTGVCGKGGSAQHLAWQEVADRCAGVWRNAMGREGTVEGDTLHRVPVRELVSDGGRRRITNHVLDAAQPGERRSFFEAGGQWRGAS